MATRTPLDEFASPTPASEVLPYPDREAGIALVFQKPQLSDTNEVKTKEFLKTANTVPGVEDIQLSPPLLQPSQVSIPQVKKEIDCQEFPSPKHATSGGPDERVVGKTSTLSRESKQDQTAKSIENFVKDDRDVNCHQNKHKDLSQDLTFEEQFEWQLKYNLEEQKRLMEDQNRSRVIDMEQKVQSLTAAHEVRVATLRSDIEVLTKKLEEEKNGNATLRARCREFMSEVDQEILKRREVADLRSSEAKWDDFMMILTTIVVLLYFIIFSFRLYSLYWVNLAGHFIHLLYGFYR